MLGSFTSRLAPYLCSLLAGFLTICETYHIRDVSYVQEVRLEFHLYREFFRALSNQTRFSIVQLLRGRPHYVNEMVEKLRIEQSRVSHNLACLLNCGFVEWEWNGKNKVYRLNPDLNPVLTGIERHLVKYAPALDCCQTLASESKLALFVARPSQPGPSQRHYRRRLRVKG